jgi:hypothetical protein
MFLLGCAETEGHPYLHSPAFDIDEVVLLTAVNIFHDLATRRGPHPLAGVAPPRHESSRWPPASRAYSQDAQT